MRSRLFAEVLLLAACAGFPSAHAKDPLPTAQQLIDAAHQQADLTVIAPYILTGTVVINPGEKSEQKGRLTIYRDRERSRVELQFGAYNETRVSTVDRKYIPRGKHDLTAAGLIDLDRSWDPGLPPHIPAGKTYKFGKVKHASIGGHDAWCFDKKWQSDKERLCFDAEHSVLISQNFGPKDNREYLDYSANQQPTFPRLVKVAKEGMVPLEVRDISVARGNLDEKLFSKPPDTIELETCKNIKPPQPVSTPEPPFPDPTHHAHETVRLYAIINIDGGVEEVQVLNQKTDAYTESAKDAVMGWKFKPATCSGRPVNTEMNLDIDFKLY